MKWLMCNSQKGLLDQKLEIPVSVVTDDLGLLGGVVSIF